MKFLSRFSLLLVLSTVCVATGATAGTVRYFRIAERDAMNKFAFRHEVKGKDTNTIRDYRVTYDDQGRMVRWEYLRAGNLSEDPDFDVARTEASYDNSFIHYRYFSKHGKRRKINGGQYGEKFKLDTDLKTGNMYPYDSHDNMVQEDDNGVCRYGWVLNDKGQIIKVVNMNSKGVRTVRTDGVFEMTYAYDDQGRVIENNRYDKDSKLLPTGYSTLRYTYDKNGNNIRILYLTAKGEPLEDSEMAAKVDMEYDTNGYEISRALYDGFGSMMSLRKWTYDHRGNIVESRRFGADENLVQHDPIIQSVFSDKCMLTDTYKRDKKGRLRIHTIFKQNAQSDETEVAMFDSLGKPTPDDDNYSSVKFTYDDRGNETSMIYYGPDGNPVGRSEDSIAYVYRSFNEEGKITELKYLDADKNLKESADEHFAWLKLAYDDDGDVKEAHVYDAKGNEKKSD